MTREQYLNKRQELSNKAQSLLDEGKIDDANGIMGEIANLDTTFENHSIAMANLNALNNKVQIDNGIVIPTSSNLNPVIIDEDKLYVNAWAKSMQNKALNQEELDVFNKINNNTTTKDNQILIPNTVVKGIWKEAGELFPLVGDIAVTNVPGGITIIKEDAIEDTTSDWYDEDTQTEEGELNFGEVNLTGCELSKAVKVSWKLRNMSIEEFIPYITTKLAERMGKALATGVLKGKGHAGAESSHKDQPLGIVTSLKAESSTPQVISYTTVDYDMVISMLAKIKKYGSGASFYATNDMIWNGLAKIVDKNGRPIFVPNPVDGGVGRLFGKIVKEDDSLGDTELLLGNVEKGYAMNINEKVTLHNQELMRARKTEYMTYAIVDGTPITNKAFVFAEKKVTMQADMRISKNTKKNTEQLDEEKA